MLRGRLFLLAVSLLWAMPAGGEAGCPTARAYVTNAAQGTLSAIDLETRTVVATSDAGTVPAALAVSPNGCRGYVASLGAPSLSLIDAGGIESPKSIDLGAAPTGVALGPDGRRAYITTIPMEFLNWAAIRGGAGMLVHFPLLYSASRYGSNLVILDTDSGKIVNTIRVGRGASSVALSADGRLAYCTNLAAQTVWIVDTQTNEVSDTIPIMGLPKAIALSQDGRFMLVAASDASAPDHGVGSLAVLDVASRKPIALLPTGRGPAAVVVAQQGKRAFVSNFYDSTVSVFDLDSHAAIGTVPVGGGPGGMATAMHGRFVYVANSEVLPRGNTSRPGTVSVLDTDKREVVSTITVGNAAAYVAVGGGGEGPQTGDATRLLHRIQPATDR